MTKPTKAGTWVLEYSEASQQEGLYPLHVTTKADSERRGPGALGWVVIATGTAAEMYNALQDKAEELGL